MTLGAASAARSALCTAMSPQGTFALLLRHAPSASPARDDQRRRDRPATPDTSIPPRAGGGPVCVTYLENARAKKGFHHFTNFETRSTNCLPQISRPSGYALFSGPMPTFGLEEAISTAARRRLAQYSIHKVEFAPPSSRHFRSFNTTFSNPILFYCPTKRRMAGAARAFWFRLWFAAAQSSSRATPGLPTRHRLLLPFSTMPRRSPESHCRRLRPHRRPARGARSGTRMDAVSTMQIIC
jgi:hypothetical protein